jgi:tRNA A22 N-methylase
MELQLNYTPFVNEILAKKARLRTALELMPKGFEVYYDLFCDHGLLGYALKESFNKKVIFNDSQEGITLRLKENFHLGESEIELGKAQDLIFKENSGVFMLGVGGHLLNECFLNWEKCRKENLYGGHTFVIGAHYYQLELREVLRALGAELLDQKFVYERGEGYEILLVNFFEKYLGDGKNILDFDELYWSQVVRDEPLAMRYLEKRAKSISKVRNPSVQQLQFGTSLRHFMNKVNSKS